MSRVVAPMCSGASKRDNTVNFSQAVVQISGTGNSASQNSNTQGSSAQSSSSQANNGIQNGNTQISGEQSNTSPAVSISPALGVCPVNQGYPRNPGSCDSGSIPLFHPASLVTQIVLREQHHIK
ncbi:MAG: hypothetical protein Q9205_003083 [Flavoplaca limonia]